MDKRFVTLRPLTVTVVDPALWPLLGGTFALPGGTELVAAEGGYTVSDPYLPAFVCAPLPHEASAIAALPPDHRGPRTSFDRAACRHSGLKRGGKRVGCLACYHKDWTGRAAQLGIAAPPPKEKEKDHGQPTAEPDASAEPAPQRKRRPRKSKAGL